MLFSIEKPVSCASRGISEEGNSFQVSHVASCCPSSLRNEKGEDNIYLGDRRAIWDYLEEVFSVCSNY